ncbi:hypothetical protein FS837_003957 [Tulasnella sp. UAMH 9824]|nr:hypothetical protein FS837_003957 [Tulasnella sp. UAMH 9824]
MELSTDQNANGSQANTSLDVEWRYEMRRECQQIVPGVLLGPFQVSKDLNKLKELNISHILCIRDQKESFSVRPRFPEQFTYLVLDVQDTEEQNLIRLFPQAKAFIENALAQGGQVLVHCNGGISLAPSFVIMFVMEHLNLNWEDALHLVQNRRYCISPNGGFLTQIKEYESIYKAAQQVQKFGGANRTVSTTRRKRGEDSEDEDETAEPRRREAPIPRNLVPPAPAVPANASQDVEMA